MQVRYTLGGVDWGRVAFHELDAGEIEKLRPGLTSTVAASFERPTTDPAGDVWLGSGSELPATWQETSWWSSSYVAVPILVAVALPAWVRRRREASIESDGDAS